MATRGRYGTAATEPVPALSPDTHPNTLGDPGDIYQLLFKENPLTCSFCFQRIKSRFKVSTAHYGDYGFSTNGRTPDERGKMKWWFDEHVPEDTRYPLLDREFYETSLLENRSENDYPPSYAAGEKHRLCASCADSHTDKSALSKREALDAAYNISITLLEYGIGHDWMALVERVRDLKSIPEHARNDDHVFQQAITDAIDAVQMCPTVPQPTENS